MTTNEATVEVSMVSDEGELSAENPPPDEATQPETGNTDSRPLRRSERVRASAEKTAEDLKTYKFGETVYKVGNSVYYEETGSDCFAIGSIAEFRSVRRGKCEVVLKRFARTFEVWDVAKAGVLDREAESTADPRILARELFNMETHAIVDSSLLRGKCSVTFPLTFDAALQSFDPLVEDSFFCAYAYQPDYRRINTLRAEIRVGERFQVSSLPVCRQSHPRRHEGCGRHANVFRRLQEAPAVVYSPSSLSAALHEDEGDEKTFQHGEERCLRRLARAQPRQWEELRWRADALPQETLAMYLAAVRSLVATRAYGGGGGGCGGIADSAVEAEAAADMRSAANGQIVSELAVTAQHALDVLHACAYDIPRALQTLCRQPLPDNADTPQHWTREQVRRLGQGLQLHGKDFFAIHRDFFSPDTAIDPLAPQQHEEADADADDPDEATVVETTTTTAAAAAAGEREDLSRLNGAEDRRWLCAPSREKSVKQLVSFFYYWKRKGHLPTARAPVSSRNTNTDAGGSTAFHAALNSGGGAGGGRGGNAKRKRIDASGTTATTANGNQLDNGEGANGSTPRVEHGVSPLPEGLGDPVTNVSASSGAESPPSSDGMCSNCSLAPVEPQEPAPTATNSSSHKQSQQQTATLPFEHQAMPRSLCKDCALFWRKYVRLPKPGEVLTKKSPHDVDSDSDAVCKKTKKSETEGETVDEMADNAEEDSTSVVALGAATGNDVLPFETKQEEPRPLSGCSFCDVYSPTYAHCWSSPLPPPPRSTTPSVEDCVKQELSLPPPPQQPEDLSVTSMSAARLKRRQAATEGEVSCARIDIVFDPPSRSAATGANTPPPQQKPPPQPLWQQRPQTQAPRRFDAHSLLYEPSGMSQPQKRRAVSPPQSPPRPKQAPPPPPPPINMSPQQQPIELTARSRPQLGPPRQPPYPPPTTAVEEYMALLMRDSQRLANAARPRGPTVTACTTSTTTTTTTTQARGTFYPPPAEPAPPPPSSRQQASLSMARRPPQQQQQPPPPQPQPPPPPPFLQRGNPQQQSTQAQTRAAAMAAAAAAYMQQQQQHQGGSGDAGMNAFLRDQFLASSHARGASFHTQQQQQQEQERLLALVRLQQQQQQAHLHQQRSEAGEAQQQMAMSALAQLMASGRTPAEAQALLVQAMASSAAAAAARTNNSSGETQGTALAQLMMQQQQRQQHQPQPQRNQEFSDPDFFNYLMQCAVMAQQNTAHTAPPQPPPQPPAGASRGGVDYSLQRASRTTQPPTQAPPPPPTQQQQALLMQYMMQQQQQQAFHEQQQQRQNYFAAAAAQQQRRTSREQAQDASLQEMARWLAAAAASASAGGQAGGGGGRQVSPQALQALLQQFMLQQGQR